MKKTTITFLTLCTLAVGLALATPAPTNAVTNTPFTFQPIVSVPLATGNGSLNVNNQVSISCYINSVFKLAIAVAVVLAVLMIIIDGFKYMTSEAAGNKKDSLGGIRSAMFGLILLLASWLILHIVNPQILQLNVASFDGAGLTSCGTGVAAPAGTPVSGTASGGNVPNPLDNPAQSTFGQPTNPLTTSLPDQGEIFGAGDYCFTTTGGGAECFSDAATCGSVHDVVGGGATSACIHNDSTAAGPPSQAVCDASNNYQCAPGLSCTVASGSGTCVAKSTGTQ